MTAASILPLVLLPLLVPGELAQGTECSSPYVSVGSNCYYFSRDKLSWDEAYVKCMHRGGYLANFENLDEYFLIRRKLAGINSGSMYTIGAQHFGNLTSGDSMWVRKGYHSTLTYDMFGSREPYGSITKTKYCLYLSPEIEYASTAHPCSTTAQYICEKNRNNKKAPFIFQK